MAEEKTSFKFDEKAVADKIAAIEASVNKVAGQKGYNPFLWMKQFGVSQLVERFRIKKERSPELQTAILKLPSEVPKLPAS